MNTMNLRCKAFSGEAVKLNKIQISDEGTVRVWDSVAGHYTTCHSLTARTIGKISVCLAQNNTFMPLNYCPPALKITAR